ncbi:endolytic transglycosylase MltG [Sinosporangium siamense]|uniref:Endolytic murein transglycosylase n=2 Tax=Sinosporangium siamense TaxID=1367973 RepID=A0A919RK80_9ACTN|nr:endolytic transglycosylase MltG [Sinosporangium siamense]GII95308.1 ABC transporter substrate-binding protein [Sinosporangium siamense]
MDFLTGSDDEGSGRRSRGSSGRSGKRGGRRRRRRRNRGGFLAPMLALIILVGVVGGAGYYGYVWLSDVMVADDFPGQGSGEVVIEIKEGQSATEVAQTLEEKGVVASARAFTNAIGDAGKSSSLQPGEYKLRKGMSAALAVGLLDPQKRIQNRFVIPEGYRVSDVINTIAKETGKPKSELLKASRDGEALGLPAPAKGKAEGYLFPAAYEFTDRMSATDIFANMVERYEKEVSAIDLEGAAKKLGFTPHQILTIASIVEAESGKPSDMGRVARVIYNRLGINMHLRMDSTVMYAHNTKGIAATHKQLEIKSPYNTYKYQGLPPGPITNPGMNAIKAALNPTPGPWIFFVTTDPKNAITKFTEHESEFNQFKAEFERNWNNG